MINKFYLCYMDELLMLMLIMYFICKVCYIYFCMNYLRKNFYCIQLVIRIFYLGMFDLDCKYWGKNNVVVCDILQKLNLK